MAVRDGHTIAGEAATVGLSFKTYLLALWDLTNSVWYQEADCKCWVIIWNRLEMVLAFVTARRTGGLEEAHARTCFCCTIFQELDKLYDRS